MHSVVGKLIFYAVEVEYSLVDRWCTPCAFMGAVQCKTCRVTCAYTAPVFLVIAWRDMEHHLLGKFG
jgi:hypothetical protein